MKLLSTILRLSLFAIGSAKAHSAIDADGEVDGVFTPEPAAALAAEKHSLVTTLADIVAAATYNLRSSVSSFINEEDDSPPLLRGPVKGKDSANLANVNVGEVVDPGAVDCINGYTSSGSGGLVQSCYEACNNGDDCCGPTENACVGFTGKVAKDGSCMGTYACYLAGGNGGSVGLISGQSCTGERACYGAGYYGGSVGSISGGSCIANYACAQAGYLGSVGSITGQSCVGVHACAYVGSGDSGSGSVGSISGGSCIGEDACEKLGWNARAVVDLAGCCTTDNKCREASDLPAACS